MNVVKDMLKAGKAAVGTSASLASPVELLADAGFDFLLFDTQHSPVEIKELQHQLKAMKGKKAIPIVRVGDNNQDQICYALDIGAKGIIVPMVNSKEEAAHMVRCCKYPPEGIRSAAGMRGEWGEFDDFDEYMSAVNDEVLIPEGDIWGQRIAYGYIMRPWELKYTRKENAKMNLFCILL